MPQIQDPGIPGNVALGRPVPRGDNQPSTALVLIHGAGRFDENYHEPILAELQRRLSKPITCIPVLYSYETNPLGTARVSVGPDPEQSQVQAALQSELARDALTRIMAALPASELLTALKSATIPAGFTTLYNLYAQLRSPQSSRLKESLLNELERTFPGLPLSAWLKTVAAPAASLAAGLRAGGIDLQGIIREIALYLTDSTVHQQIHFQVKRRLDEAMQYDQIVLVSHSLGCLVAFDVLRECGDAYSKVSYWFTLGNPLLKIRRLGFPTDLGKITLATVRQWYNLYDTTDIIANPIGPILSAPYYPVHDIFVDVGLDPMDSHDYFRDSPTLDMIAATL